MGSLDDRAHRPKVHIPATLRHVVSVTDVVPKLRPFAAHFTYSCHFTNSAIFPAKRVSAFKPQDSLQQPAPPNTDGALEG